MKYLKVSIVLCFLMYGNMMQSQELSKHQWNNRILVIISEHINNSEFRKQIQALKDLENALDERKLLVYQITPNQYRLGVEIDKSWNTKPSKLYKKFKTNDAPFEVFLIGLDGSIKLRRNKPITSEELFNIIDAMPMRQSELKTKGTSKN